MRFARSRPGLILWCAIALLVILVPQWRLRASRQLSGSVVEVMMSPNVQSLEMVNAISQSEFGLNAANSARAVRRFPDDVAAQLAQFDVSDLKQRYDAIRNPIAIKYVVPNLVGTSKPNSRSQAKMAQTRAQLRAARPQLWRLTDAYFARYDALELRYPVSNLVRSQRLRDAMYGEMIADEGPLPLATDASIINQLQAQLPGEPWLSPQGRERAIATARAGARQEPDNAFWPWMETIFQFSLGRNADALRALEVAGSCAKFDDYSFQAVQSRLDLLRQLRAVSWEDEFIEWSLFPLPHLAKMRSATRAAMGQMRLARARDDEKAAFAWPAASARAGVVVARTNRGTLIASLVGEAICAISWRGALETTVERLPRANTYSSDAQTQDYYHQNRARDAQFFAAMARKRGDDALARQTLAALAAFDTSTLAVWNVSNHGSMLWRLEALARDYWLGAQWLILSLSSATLWGAIWLLTRARAAEVASLRARMLLPSLFLAGVSGAMMGGARAILPSLSGFTSFLTETRPAEGFTFNAGEMRLYLPALVAAIWLLFVVASALLSLRSLPRKRVQAAPVPRAARRARVLGGLILGALVVFGFGVAYAPTGGDSPLFWGALCALTSTAIIASVAAVKRSRGEARKFVISFVAAFWTGVIAFSLSFADGDWPVIGTMLFYVGVILMITAIFFGLRLTSRAGWLYFGFQLLARARIAAGVLAVSCAITYLGIALWTIPVERQARALMNRQLQIGEAAFLREQMGKGKG